MFGKLQTASDNNISKISRKSISMDVKLQVIRRLEAGDRQVDVGTTFNLATSTIRTIVKNAEKIKACAATTSKLSSTKVTRSRSHLIEKMENQLSIWLHNQAQDNLPLSRLVIMEKARNIFNKIQKEEGDMSVTFTASRGWFHRFKKRSNLNIKHISTEPTSLENEDFPSKLKTLIEETNCPPELVFNVEETNLFWKRIPSYTFTSHEENNQLAIAKDRLTLLLGGNAKGDFKLKPLVVKHYHCEAPVGLKNNQNKPNLPIIWKFNKKTRMTIDIFHEWFLEHFCQEVKQYCEARDLKPKALLIINKAREHSNNLESLPSCIPVKVLYLPPTLTPSIQPMNQGVLSGFKAYYLQRTIKQLIEETDGQDTYINKYIQNYDELKALFNIQAAWDEVSSDCLNGAWRKIWPEVCDKLEFQPEEVIQNPVQFANEVNDGNKEILYYATCDNLQNNNAEKVITIKLPTEFVKTNIKEEKQETKRNCVAAECCKVEEEEITPTRVLTTEFLSNSMATISHIMDQFTCNDPDSQRSNKVKEGVLEIVSCYRELLEMRSKTQANLDDYCFKKPKLEDS